MGVIYFFIGLIVGTVLGFLGAALFSTNGEEDDET